MFGQPLGIKLGGGLRACAFSPCGRLIAAGGYDNEVSVVRVADGALVARIERSGPVWTMCWSPNGLRLVVGGMDCKIGVLDASRGTVLHETRRGHWIFCSAWSPDGRWLAVGGLANGTEHRRALVVVEARSSEAIELDLGGASIWAAAYSPDSASLACACSDGRCVCLSADSRATRFEARTGREARAVAFSADGAALAVGYDAGVVVLDPHTGARLVDCPSTTKVLACAFFGATSLLVGRFGGLDLNLLDLYGPPRCLLLALGDDLPRHRTETHPPGPLAINAIALNPDSSLLAFARSDGLLGLAPLHRRHPPDAFARPHFYQPRDHHPLNHPRHQPPRGPPPRHYPHHPGLPYYYFPS